MKKGVEFHINLQKEDFTLTRGLGKALMHSNTQSLQEKQEFDRKIKGEQVTGESIRGRRKVMNKVNLA